MKNWRKKIDRLLGLALGSLLLGCVGTNPAGPPAPLAEVPSAISIPESVEVNTSEVAVAVPSSMSFDLIRRFKNEVLPIGGEFFDAIVFGFNINQLANTAVESVLIEISRFDIPTNPVTRTFSAPDAFTGSTIKIDFADFDFDGTGTTRGCTGCTCPTGCDAPCPTQAAFEDLGEICYRIWNDPSGTGEFVPLMAGVMTALPIRDDPDTPANERNPGVGSFRVTLAHQDTSGEPPTSTNSFGADYNHRDPDRPLDLTTEYYLSTDSLTDAQFDFTVSYVKVEQVALDDPADEGRLLKTIQESVNQPIPAEPETNSTLQYLARYRTDFDFWSGTFQDFLRFPEFAFAPPPDIDNFTAECAQLSTAVGVEEGTCRDIGIDVSEVPFLPLLTAADPRVNLPADFPAAPTF
ncbi:MAG TPA: hypothetical protein VJR29_06790 [bacterium]|nr:hypothetical protein [bacterium]